MFKQITLLAQESLFPPAALLPAQEVYVEATVL